MTLREFGIIHSLETLVGSFFFSRKEAKALVLRTSQINHQVGRSLVFCEAELCFLLLFPEKEEILI
jgi:hypothetical protein